MNETKKDIRCHAYEAGKEIPYLNYIRVTAALLVLLLHCITPVTMQNIYYATRAWWLCQVLNAFCRAGVPLFFMLSGYLLLRDERTADIGAFYKKRLPRVLLPLFSWNLLYYLYFTLTAGARPSLMGFLRELLNSGSAYHLWFLYTLLGLYLLAPFLRRLTVSCTKRQFIWLFLLIFISASLRPLFSKVTGIYVNLFGAPLDGYIGYFLLGWLLGAYPPGKKARIALWCGGAAGVLIGVLGNYLFSASGQLDFFLNGGCTPDHFLVAAALFTLLQRIPWREDRRFTGAVGRLAKLTYGVYLVQILILEPLKSLLAAYAPGLSPIPLILIKFVVTALASTLAAFLISRSKTLSRALM